jgi:hypothetical protein
MVFIIAGAVGGVILIAAIAAVVFASTRRNKKKKDKIEMKDVENKAVEKTPLADDNPSSKYQEMPHQVDVPLRSSSLIPINMAPEWKIDWKEVEIGKEIGAGAFGVVRTKYFLSFFLNYLS